MPAFSKETLLVLTSSLESFAKGAALVSAICGLLYLYFNRPLKKIEALESEARAKEILTLRERAAIAERQLLEVQERIQDRTLSSEQQAKFISALTYAPHCQIDIRAPKLSEEAKKFATLLGELLGKAGWPTGVIANTLVEMPEGIIILHRDEPVTRGAVEALRMALTEAGFEPKVEKSSDVSGGRIRLIVGVKR